jgi:hypothetical protein
LPASRAPSPHRRPFDAGGVHRQQAGGLKRASFAIGPDAPAKIKAACGDLVLESPSHRSVCLSRIVSKKMLPELRF